MSSEYTLGGVCALLGGGPLVKAERKTLGVPVKVKPKGTKSQAKKIKINDNQKTEAILQKVKKNRVKTQSKAVTEIEEPAEPIPEPDSDSYFTVKAKRVTIRNNERHEETKTVQKPLSRKRQAPTIIKDDKQGKKPKLIVKKDHPQTNNDDEFTIFVGNLPTDTNVKRVKKIFSDYGEIANARIRCVPADSSKTPIKIAARNQKLITKGNSVCAYVRFAARQSAICALAANGKVIDGHHIKVDLTLKQERKQVDKRKGIYIQNLPYDVEDDVLWDFFGDCGKIESVRVIKSKEKSYLGIGVAYVNFESAAAVELALHMNGQNIKDRPLYIQRCRAAVKPHGRRDATRFQPNSRGAKTSYNAPRNTYSRPPRPKQKNQFATSNHTSGFQGRIAERNNKAKKKWKPNKEMQRKRRITQILASQPNKPNFK